MERPNDLLTEERQVTTSNCDFLHLQNHTEMLLIVNSQLWTVHSC